MHRKQTLRFQLYVPVYFSDVQDKHKMGNFAYVCIVCFFLHLNTTMSCDIKEKRAIAETSHHRYPLIISVNLL